MLLSSHPTLPQIPAHCHRAQPTLVFRTLTAPAQGTPAMMSYVPGCNHHIPTTNNRPQGVRAEGAQRAAQLAVCLHLCTPPLTSFHLTTSKLNILPSQSQVLPPSTKVGVIAPKVTRAEEVEATWVLQPTISLSPNLHRHPGLPSSKRPPPVLTTTFTSSSWDSNTG